jgi:hypothetical protein
MLFRFFKQIKPIREAHEEFACGWLADFGRGSVFVWAIWEAFRKGFNFLRTFRSSVWLIGTSSQWLLRPNKMFALETRGPQRFNRPNSAISTQRDPLTCAENGFSVLNGSQTTMLAVFLQESSPNIRFPPNNLHLPRRAPVFQLGLLVFWPNLTLVTDSFG